MTLTDKRCGDRCCLSLCKSIKVCICIDDSAYGTNGGHAEDLCRPLVVLRLQQRYFFSYLQRRDFVSSSICFSEIEIHFVLFLRTHFPREQVTRKTAVCQTCP
jgi:hypothetical protein